MGAGRFVLPASLAGVAAGVLAVDVAALPVVAPVIAGASAVVVGSLGRSAAIGIIGVAFIAFGAGAWRGEAAATTGHPGQASVADLVDGGEHELVGTVLDDPRPREDRLQLVIGDIVAARDGKAIS
ncbi:MAG: hypothetical protein H0W98_01005, partial [Chloroflexi bacterium]|nr:hypothetical protein [Chloroflexota bacterium]